MKKSLNHYIKLADLFDYPDVDYSSRIFEIEQLLNAQYPEAVKYLEPFAAYMTQADLLEQQELFIRSFDVQSVTTLDLGYVIFGDDYKRGELLVNLNREHREVGNDCGVELADHLPNVLRLLPKMQDEILCEELVVKIVAPALYRMIRGFEPEQIVLKEKFYKRKHKTIIDRPVDHYTIFQLALKAIYAVLQEDFSIETNIPTEKTSDFLKNIVTEAKLEG